MTGGDVSRPIHVYSIHCSLYAHLSPTMADSESDMAEFRKELLQTTNYIGVTETLDDLVWKRIGREDMLLTKEVASAYDAVLEPTASTDTAVIPSSSSSETPEFKLAELTLIAKISPNNFWLIPCGYWKEPTKYAPTFADLKLNCQLVAPNDPLFSDDFNTALKNIESLMALVETKGNTKRGILDTEDNARNSIKVRHIVFEIKEGDDDSDVTAIKLRDWPVKSDAARDARDKMDTTHRVHRIPAYDVFGELLPPIRYASALPGAVVRATISMKHWNIATDRRDAYAADIVKLRVLTPPPIAEPATPLRKRKLSVTDSGPTPSPSKRARGA
ncbi:hypothetical protein FB451DRAFT_1252655 [Mycena latifolia]|nr:hypothetical protein FB451DRAFT_1252655 [Mycena latifolia]